MQKNKVLIHLSTLMCFLEKGEKYSYLHFGPHGDGDE